MAARTAPVLLLFVAVAGCLGGPGRVEPSSDGDPVPSGAEPVPRDVYVVATDFALSLEALYNLRPVSYSVERGHEVNLTLKGAVGNQQAHNLVLEGHDVRIDDVRSGQSKTVTFRADRAGTFAYFCDVALHRALGMEGSLTVTG